MILVSACLLGRKCRYNGDDQLDQTLKQLLKDKDVKLICPEVAGGLSIPRAPAEIIGGDGADVLEGKARVLNCNTKDLTREFILGAQQAIKDLDIAEIELAILKERSPSCGVNWIYSGGFKGNLKQGSGVTAAYLKKKGVLLYTEEDIEKIKELLI